MSPRIIQMPLSGGDRKHYARQLKAAEQEHARLVKRQAEAEIVAADYRRAAQRLACQEWGVRQFIGGPVDPSPSIAAAIEADYIFLCVECTACGHGQRVDLSEVIWPRHKPIHSITKALVCKNCQRRRPNLVDLLPREPDEDLPKAARRR